MSSEGLTIDERTRGAVAVRRAINSCHRCELRSEASAPVPWSGGLGAEVAILGEAPGRTEDKEGAPFVGPAGGLIRRWLAVQGIDPETVAFINAVNCYPATSRTPLPAHREACRTHLAGQLIAVQPKFVISVGLSALAAILPDRPELTMKLVRGRPIYINQVGPWKLHSPFTLWPTWHPAATFRTPRLREQIEDDLAKFVAWRDIGGIYPEICIVKKCNMEVWEWDANGIAWCQRHVPNQMSLDI